MKCPILVGDFDVPEADSGNYEFTPILEGDELHSIVDPTLRSFIRACMLEVPAEADRPTLAVLCN